MDVWEKDVSEACVVCSWETFELVAEQKVCHKTARGSHSSWPWKRDSESSQPTEGNITLEVTKVKIKFLHLNDCLGMWCKWQRTKWTNWMMWQWTDTLCNLMPCMCLFNCCFLTLSHCVHEPRRLFLGWAITRCSEKELGDALLCGWGCVMEPGEITAGFWPQALKQVPWNLVVAAPSHRRQHRLCSGRHRHPRLSSPAAVPRVQHHSQPHVLTSLPIQLKTPSAPTKGGSLCTHCGMMLRPVLVVTGRMVKGKEGLAAHSKPQPTQPHGGRNILASVMDDLDIAFRQPFPSQISPCCKVVIASKSGNSSAHTHRTLGGTDFVTEKLNCLDFELENYFSQSQ